MIKRNNLADLNKIEKRRDSIRIGIDEKSNHGSDNATIREILKFRLDRSRIDEGSICCYS